MFLQISSKMYVTGLLDLDDRGMFSSYEIDVSDSRNLRSYISAKLPIPADAQEKNFNDPEDYDTNIGTAEVERLHIELTQRSVETRDIFDVCDSYSQEWYEVCDTFLNAPNTLTGPEAIRARLESIEVTGVPRNERGRALQIERIAVPSDSDLDLGEQDFEGYYRDLDELDGCFEGDLLYIRDIAVGDAYKERGVEMAIAARIIDTLGAGCDLVVYCFGEYTYELEALKPLGFIKSPREGYAFLNLRKYGCPRVRELENGEHDALCRFEVGAV